MKQIVFATNNKHKLQEIREIVGDKLTISSLLDIGCTEDIPEKEPTLEGNALAKARYVKEHYGYDCFADDTGLEVEALNGQPGVRSARYAPGEGHDSQANMKLLLENMKDKQNRSARFRTVIALIVDGKEQLVEGIVNGYITEQPSGSEGFGYDPVFVPEGFEKTFAMMTSEEKNNISHRGRATRKLLDILKNL
ncbi:MAG: non-canonical purine NTP diphosphatase [Bacteroidales bacterium]|nr:non-canonical purine NTP diphosphatase [Bacteroidales bacterium]